MTLQQLRYLIAVAEKGSITEAAKSLFISQPSLSTAIKEVEQNIGFRVFNRHRTGVTLTAKGMEFLGYARQVVQQMDALESKYGDAQETRRRFCVSTQHYTFTANAFVELVKEQDREQYDLFLQRHRANGLHHRPHHVALRAFGVRRVHHRNGRDRHNRMDRTRRDAAELLPQPLPRDQHRAGTIAAGMRLGDAAPTDAIDARQGNN